MTKFSISDIAHLASLSGLSLSDDEAEKLRTSLGSITEYVDMLDELDVSDVEPVYQVTELYNVFDKDEVGDGGASRDELLRLAPESLDAQIRVPKVL